MLITTKAKLLTECGAVLTQKRTQTKVKPETPEANPHASCQVTFDKGVTDAC